MTSTSNAVLCIRKKIMIAVRFEFDMRHHVFLCLRGVEVLLVGDEFSRPKFVVLAIKLRKQKLGLCR